MFFINHKAWQTAETTKRAVGSFAKMEWKEWRNKTRGIDNRLSAPLSTSDDDEHGARLSHLEFCNPTAV
jgi:hypothetical protein